MASTFPRNDAASAGADRQNHGPIDLNHLSRQTFGDAGLEGEILRLFDEMSQTTFRRIEESTTVTDLVLHFHSLRSAAAGIGAFTLMDLAGTAENELRAGAAVNPEWVDDIAMALEETSGFIAQRINALAA